MQSEFVPSNGTKQLRRKCIKRKVTNYNKMTNQSRKYNLIAVDRLQIKYGVTKHFIRKCLRGDRTSETALTIKKEYHQLVVRIEEATK